MSWTSERDMLLYRESIVNESIAYVLKTSSRKSGKCLNKIANILNDIENAWFKVDQLSIRDRLKKLLKAFAAKENAEHKTSGINPEYSEIDDLLHDINQRKHVGDVHENQSSEEKNKREGKGTVEAEPVRQIPAGIYMFKVSNRNTTTRCEICLKLTIKTPERRH